MTITQKEMADKKCGHCGLTYGRHAKKGFMRCLYTANFNLYNIIQQYNDIKDELDRMKLNTLKGGDTMENYEVVQEVAKKE